MNALNRALEYAQMKFQKTGHVPSIEEVISYAREFLLFIYEPTIDEVENISEGEIKELPADAPF